MCDFVPFNGHVYPDGVVTNVDFWYSFGRDVGYVYTTLSQHCVPDFDFLTCC